jgi:hypothetical protein
VASEIERIVQPRPGTSSTFCGKKSTDFGFHTSIQKANRTRRTEPGSQQAVSFPTRWALSVLPDSFVFHTRISKTFPRKEQGRNFLFHTYRVVSHQRIYGSHKIARNFLHSLHYFRADTSPPLHMLQTLKSTSRDPAKEIKYELWAIQTNRTMNSSPRSSKAAYFLHS